LFEENDEVVEMLFYLEGEVDIGFVMDRKINWCLRMKDKIMIAAYNCTFSIRTMAAYKCNTNCRGYSLKKNLWDSIINGNDFEPEI